MKVTPTELPDVLLIEPRLFADQRGFFFESYHREKYRQLGISDEFVQDNHAKSQRDTLRGLHYQLSRPQVKLCRVISGEVLDVAVDVRVGSPTFGQWVSLVLSAENQRQVYVPGGFAHAFLALSEHAEFLYKCTELYHPEDEKGVLYLTPAFLGRYRDRMVKQGDRWRLPMSIRDAAHHPDNRLGGAVRIRADESACAARKYRRVRSRDARPRRCCSARRGGAQRASPADRQCRCLHGGRSG